MLKYEPYLKPKRRRSADEGDTAQASDSNGSIAASSDSSAPPDAGTGGSPTGSAPAEASEQRKPWWQADFDAGKPEIKLSDMTEDSDAIVAKRMVKGFFVAIDRTFSWNNRRWYKTTQGLVAPADRLAIAKSPTLQGIELAGTDPKQPVAFILSTRAHKYTVTTEGDRKRAAAEGPVERFERARLTGQVAQAGGIVYRETTEGWWMKAIDGTYTDPGPPPEGLRPGEKWIDVNLSRQTLVAFEGDRPVYATLVSSGKKARDKINDKIHDHETVKGSFRIREKHLSTTMDGDGPAPGDMPYSIEDVPFVMYFEGSYALHGAFWHSNFGHEQSHGCVNLAPLDAKRIFFWTDPPLPEGWHGIIAPPKDAAAQGTRVVVHD
jgi:lipoprotein-anchoring transpeptidase ErfK/SrfK